MIIQTTQDCESWLLQRKLFTCLYNYQVKRAKWALIYVNESWLLQRKLLSSLYDYSAEWIKWVLIYVFATHVDQSENRKNRLIYCIAQMCICAKAESCLRSIYVCDVYELQRVRKDVAVVLCIWAKTVSCLYNVCDCNACKLIRKSKLIDLLHHTNVYVCKSWVMSLQCICVWCIWVAAYAQRRCCCSVYMSKDCVMFLQCMWLQCM